MTTTIESADDLAEALRKGRLCVPATEIKFSEPRIEEGGLGMLIADGDQFYLQVRYFPVGEFSLNDDRLSPIDELELKADGRFLIKLLRARPEYTPMMSLAGRVQRFEIESVVMADEKLDAGEVDRVRITAKIARSTLHHHNLVQRTQSHCSLIGQTSQSASWTGLGGESVPYRYRITQEGEDLLIEVNLMDGHRSPSAEADSRFIEALLKTFVWMNGGQPFAYHFRHERGDRYRFDRLQPIKDRYTAKHRLLSTRNRSLLRRMIAELVAFFSQDSDLSKGLGEFLWQYHHANAEAPLTLGSLLQICTLLEGVIGLTLRHGMGLSYRQIEKLPPPPSADSTQVGKAVARFYHASTHLGLDWEEEFKSIFELWKATRNRLAHGDLERFLRSQELGIVDRFWTINQAFNVISLRLAGFTGGVRLDGKCFAIQD